MGADDTPDRGAEEEFGKAKKDIGRATGDEQLEGEGRREQAAAKVKQAGEKIKDAFGN